MSPLGKTLLAMLNLTMAYLWYYHPPKDTSPKMRFFSVGLCLFVVFSMLLGPVLVMLEG